MKLKNNLFCFLGIFLVIFSTQALAFTEFTYFTEKFSKLASPPSKGSLELPLKPFIIVRHAESVYNQAVNEEKGDDEMTKIPLDSDLSDKGYHQATEIAHKVKKLLQEMGEGASISFIVSSPFQRALKTADIYNKGLEKENQKNVIYTNDGLRENYKKSMILKKIDTGVISTLDNEDPVLFKDRIRGALKVILERKENDKNGIPLIFSHSGVIKALSKSLGVNLKAPKNAIPILFIPPQDKNGAWKVKF